MTHPQTLLLHAERPNIQSNARAHQRKPMSDRTQKNTGETSLKRRATCKLFCERIHSFSCAAAPRENTHTLLQITAPISRQECGTRWNTPTPTQAEESLVPNSKTLSLKATGVKRISWLRSRNVSELGWSPPSYTHEVRRSSPCKFCRPTAFSLPLARFLILEDDRLSKRNPNRQSLT